MTNNIQNQYKEFNNDIGDVSQIHIIVDNSKRLNQL
jgi:hypothetical protein